MQEREVRGMRSVDVRECVHSFCMVQLYVVTYQLVKSGHLHRPAGKMQYVYKKCSLISDLKKNECNSTGTPYLFFPFCQDRKQSE